MSNFSSPHNVFCPNKRNCWSWAISPLPTMFSALKKNSPPFPQISSCRLQNLSVWKIIKFVVWVRVNLKKKPKEINGFNKHIEKAMFVKHWCPRKGHFLENLDRERQPWLWYLRKGFISRNIHICEIWNLSNLPFKSYGKCKICCGQTDRPKTICPRSMWRHIK